MEKNKSGSGENCYKVIFTIIFVLILSHNSLFSQIRIYVNTDLEGISGVFKFDQTREKDTPLNLQACEYFMGDLAAVIRGLKDGGATEIVILDGHGPQAVLPHLMEPGAKYITGKPRPGAGNLSCLDSSFAGMVMVGRTPLWLSAASIGMMALIFRLLISNVYGKSTRKRRPG